MRLPAGELESIAPVFLVDMDYIVFGCLSVEERCCVVPQKMNTDHCRGISLLEIQDPKDAFPDYSTQTRARIEGNRQRLKEANVGFECHTCGLLATEDQLLDIFETYVKEKGQKTCIFDVSSLPKRYFCFLMKRMVITEAVDNVLFTYTSAGRNGYATGHLAEDPMACDHLPGCASPLPPRGDTLVLSVGFESLSLRSLIEVYKYKRENTKIILPFPPDGASTRRVWNTVMGLSSGNAGDIDRGNMEIIAAWDAEQVYRTLRRWEPDSNGLTLAPYGPKPHSLGMAIFALERDCGLLYTQPKSYNPEYCTGYGETLAYVVKWEGVPCFVRPSSLDYTRPQ